MLSFLFAKKEEVIEPIAPQSEIIPAVEESKTVDPSAKSAETAPAKSVVPSNPEPTK